MFSFLEMKKVFYFDIKKFGFEKIKLIVLLIVLSCIIFYEIIVFIIFYRCKYMF